MTNNITTLANEIGAMNISKQTIEHAVNVQLNMPARTALYPLPIARANGKVGTYGLLRASMPNNAGNNGRGAYTDVWVIFNMNDGWKPLFNEQGHPVFGYDNPVRDSNPAMVKKLLTTEERRSPFNSMILSGYIGEEFIPANRDVDMTQYIAAASAVYAALEQEAAIMENGDEDNLDAIKEQVKEAYEQFVSVKKQIAQEMGLVKSNVFIAAPNGITPTVAITQTMDVKGNPVLSREALFGNAQERLTFAPQVNSFTGVVSISREEADKFNPEIEFGLREVNKGREACTVAAVAGHAGRESGIRLTVYDNISRDENRESRAEVFERVANKNDQLVITGATIRTNSYYDPKLGFNAVRFNIEVQSYVTSTTGNGPLASFDSSILSGDYSEDFDNLQEDFEQILPQAEDVEEPKRKRKVKEAA